MSIFRGPIKNPNKLRNGDLPYVADAVHFDGVSYLQSDRLSLPPQGLIGGGADGTQITIAGWFKTVWDNTFTPASPAGKGNNIPVFVVDPDVNYGPSIIAQTPNSAIFVVFIDALFDGSGNVVVPCTINYSRDGIKWYVASIPGQGVQASSHENVFFFNGLWVFLLGFPSGNFFNGRPIVADSAIHSYDGINWTLDWEPSNLNGDINIDALSGANNPVGNGVLLTTANYVPPGQATKIFLACKNAAPGPGNTPFNVVFGDSDDLPVSLFVDTLVDPAQGGGTLTFSGSSGFYTLNSLPNPVTAVRISQPDLSHIKAEYTTTAITQAIVNGNFAGATWHTVISNSSSDGAWFYSLPSGATSSGGKNVGAPGGTPTNPKVQTSIVCQVNDNFGDISPGIQDTINFWAISSLVAAQSSQQGTPYAINGFNANGIQWQQPVWMHLMFTCNSDTGQVNIYINGVKTDLSGSSIAGGNLLTVLPFTTRINQKIGVVGGDSLGSNYIGDMADFSVWNCDLSNITIIDNNNRQGLPSPYNIFIDTRTNGPTSPQFQYNTVRFITSTGSGLSPTGFFIPEPVILLSGDHITFPQNTLGSAAPFRIVGNLSNAATAPQSISSP